jgi:glycine oxidase
MAETIGIAGAGLIGRMLALELARRGRRVTVFDADGEEGAASCTYTGAGMLAPYCEIERAEPIIAEMGMAATARWPEVIATLDEPVFLQQDGTLVIAHPADRGDLDAMARNITAKVAPKTVLEQLDRSGMLALEPDLPETFQAGLYFPYEGQVDNRGLLRALATTLRAHPDIEWHTDTPVTAVRPGELQLADGVQTFDWAIDCRGIGARDALAELRGVRGELLLVEAPEVDLNRPIRMVHPRYPIYTVPRPDNIYVIGATMIDSDDDSPISVRSVLELLSAAYSLHTGFAEARLLEARVALRPAFTDNLPRIGCGDGLLQVNGLFRHGFLLAPEITACAAGCVTGDAWDGPAAALICDPS